MTGSTVCVYERERSHCERAPWTHEVLRRYPISQQQLLHIKGSLCEADTASVGDPGAAAALQESAAAARLLLPVNHAEKTQHAMLAAALHAATGPQVLAVCGPLATDL